MSKPFKSFFTRNRAAAIVMLACLACLFATHARADTTTTPDTLQTSGTGGIALLSYKIATIDSTVFTYPAQEQPLVDEIAASYEFPIRLLTDEGLKNQLDRWKKNDLGLIARRLGLEKTTGSMDTAFDQFRDFCKPTIEEGIAEIRIYYMSDLRAAFAQGVKVDGITNAPEANSVSIANYISTEHVVFGQTQSGTNAGSADISLALSTKSANTTPVTTTIAAPPAKIKVRILPLILVDEKPGNIPEKMKLFNGTLREMRWRLDESIYNAYSHRLYEIIRPELIATVDKSRSPLWIIDGFTNALPLVIMRSRNPSLEFPQLLQSLSLPPPDLAKYIATINLDTWLLTRSPATTKAESDSYYYYAMLVALDAVQENGETWMSDFFKRLREQNNDQLNIEKLYALYQETTGKDLHDSITRVKNKFAAEPTK